MAIAEVTNELTARQREVVAHVRAGLSNKEIAAELGISEDGVKAHLSRLYLRYGVTSRIALLRAVEDGGAVAALPPTLGELRAMGGRARARTNWIGGVAPREGTDKLATVRSALASVDVALDLLRDLPSETTGPVLDALRNRIASAVAALDAVGADPRRPDIVGRGA